MTPQDLMKHYEQALISQKWANVEPLLHDDVCVTFSTGTFKGKTEVQKAFEKNFSLIKDENYSISNIHWALADKEAAVCLYHFHWEGVIDGKNCSGGGRGTSALVRANDKWQILTEHLGPYAL